MKIVKKYYYMFPYVAAIGNRKGVMEIVSDRRISNFEHIESVINVINAKAGVSCIITGAPYFLRVERKFSWK